MPQGAEHFDLPQQFVTRPDELPACCEHIAAFRTFGLDTEFVGEETYHPQLCLIQVATPERLMLIDPLTVGPLDRFWDLVTDSNNEVVVHAGREETRLCRHWTGQSPANLFDLQIAAGLVGLLYPLGHGTLVQQLLNVRLPKGETRTEWRTRPLTPEQMSYAYDDVRYLLPAWQKLSSRLEKLGRTVWAKEEFTRQMNQAVPEETSVERWRKLRGTGALDRRRLAVVRALHGWREQAAAKGNRPARSICRDDLLVEIARRNPSREEDLRVIRGLPRRDLKAILATVASVRSLSPDEYPALTDRGQDPLQVQWITNVVGAVLGDLCVRQRIAPNLAASNADVKALVRARLQNEVTPADCLLTQGWRAAHLLPCLESVLDGRTSLKISNTGSDSPFTLIEDNSAPSGHRPDIS